MRKPVFIMMVVFIAYSALVGCGCESKGTNEAASQYNIGREHKPRGTDKTDQQGERKIVSNIDGQEATHGWKYDGGLSEPEWSPDGKIIVFTKHLKKYMEQHKTWHGKYEIWMTSKDGKQVKRLAEGWKLFWGKPKHLVFCYWTKMKGKTILHLGSIDIISGTRQELEKKPPAPRIEFTWDDQPYSIVDSPNYYERLYDAGRKKLREEWLKQEISIADSIGRMEIRYGVLLIGTAYLPPCNLGGKGRDIWHIISEDFSKFKVIIKNATQPSLSPDCKKIAFIRDGDLWVSRLEKPLEPATIMVKPK